MLYHPSAGGWTHCAHTFSQWLIKCQPIPSSDVFQTTCQSRVAPSSLKNARWPVSMETWPCVQCGACKVCVLGIDGNDFPTTTSHKEDTVETLQEDLQELHVWVVSSQGVNTHKESYRSTRPSFPPKPSYRLQNPSAPHHRAHCKTIFLQWLSLTSWISNLQLCFAVRSIASLPVTLCVYCGISHS